MSLATTLHRIRLFEPNTLGSINSLALNEHVKKLALLRRTLAKNAGDRSMASSMIEIWDIQNENAPFLDTVITERDDSPGLIEVLDWGRDGRLFSCGLDGNLNEYDLARNCVKKRVAVGSGAVWCMALNKDQSLVALGTEDGQVSVYNVSIADEINFVKAFPKWQNRILCLAWYEQSNSQIIVTGSCTYVALWDLNQGRCTERIRVGTKNTQIWCLTVLPDFTIAIGDSEGRTSFWDGLTGTNKKTFKSHGADVLSICKNAKGIVLSSGIDPKIAEFNVSDGDPVQGQSLDNMHTHDVRAMCFSSSGWLFSGSVDSSLRRTLRHPKQLSLYTQNFTARIQACEDLIAMQDEKQLDVWEISREVQYSSDITREPTIKKLASIESKRSIVSANISPNWIAYSTAKELCVLHRTPAKLCRVEVMSDPIVGTVERIYFLREKFLCAVAGSLVYLLLLDPKGVLFEHRLQYKHRHVQNIVVSDEFMAIALSDRTIDVINTNDWKSHYKIQLAALPSAMAFNPFRTAELWLALSNHNLFCHDVQKKEPRESFLLKSVDKCSAFRGICFSKESIIVHDDNAFYSIDAKTGDMRNVNTAYRHIAKMGNLTNKGFELYLIEVSDEMLFRKLPAAFAKKRFAT